MMNVAPKQLEISSVSAFYEEAKKAYCIIATGEKAVYANVMLQKALLSTNNFFSLKRLRRIPDGAFIIHVYYDSLFFLFFLRSQDYHCDANDNNYTRIQITEFIPLSVLSTFSLDASCSALSEGAAVTAAFCRRHSLTWPGGSTCPSWFRSREYLSQLAPGRSARLQSAPGRRALSQSAPG